MAISSGDRLLFLQFLINGFYFRNFSLKYCYFKKNRHTMPSSIHGTSTSYEKDQEHRRRRRQLPQRQSQTKC
jgi:hypothetical protein